MTWWYPRFSTALALGLLLALGCGGEGDDDSAAGDDDVADDDVADDDTTADDDDDDSAEPVLPPCAGGGWGAISDPDISIHVRADGSDDTGDGTAGNPLATLDAALRMSRDRQDDKRIAVGPGVFPASLAIQADVLDSLGDPATDSGLGIEGCGESETSLLALSADEPVVKVDEAEDVRLSGITLDGGRRALWVWSGAVVDIDFVAVENATRVGIIFGGWETIVSASNLSVSDTLPEVDGSGVEYGYGIAIQGAQVDLTDASVSGSHRIGILIDGAAATLERVSVDGTQPGSDGSLGRGIQIQNVSQALLSDLEIGAIEPNSDAGVFSQASLLLQLENTHVVATSSSALEVDGNPCGGEECPGDGIVINQRGEEDDPALYSHILLDNVVEGTARAGILVESVVAELDGNSTSGCGVVDGVTNGSIFVQGDLDTDGGDHVISGPDPVAERVDAFPLNNQVVETDEFVD